MTESRIITSNRAGVIWSGITWACVLLFLPAGLASMAMQTLLPANLGYPQLDAPAGIPVWLNRLVLVLDILVFAIPAVVVTLSNKKAKRLGHRVKGVVAGSWGVFGLVAAIALLLWFFG
ncbi:hypothetical protein [Acidipropionibacterium virtanenii]|uniref:Uncharacterized protein n=1 Tax=Acidipropionibacterium virtanenii TaxID=2057246 RepID=A0A344UX37_9ACTN|nr:hypothetical protein [Acidipropionibacterium virtanenii]AXE39835.1 hypothetical protein JS278_02699 [Acidipropionibacterium virtanenii]